MTNGTEKIEEIFKILPYSVMSGVLKSMLKGYVLVY
jgi:hypothetical protein